MIDATPTRPPDGSPARRPVVAVSSNKGGVGKTTLATNFAIYLRALHEELPVLLVGLDDQHVIDRMFALRAPQHGDGNLKHGWAERCLDRIVQLGQYGVHFVPSPPDLALLKARAEDPGTLTRILARSEWQGVIVLDTKSDLEALTINAYHAADRILIPVSDWSALEEAGKSFAILERSRLGAERARVVLTLADRRTRVSDARLPLVERLREEIRRRGWPCYETGLSRSPRVEGLNSGTGTPLSILHHARGSAIHWEMRVLTEEIVRDLGLVPGSLAAPGPSVLWGARKTGPRAAWRARSSSGS